MNTQPMKMWSMSDNQGRQELTVRVRKVAHAVARGPEDYEDTVQDMLLVILEAQAADPNFASQEPSYQVKRAWWRVKDLRKREDSQAKHQAFSIDTIGQHERIKGGKGADEVVFRNLTRAAVRNAIADLGTGATDRHANHCGELRQEIIIRRFYGEQTVEAAAQEMGLKKGTACMYSAQALQQMRGSLEARGVVLAAS